MTVIAADAEAAREATHRGDQLIVRDVLRKNLQVMENAFVRADLRLLLLHGGAGGEKDGGDENQRFATHSLQIPDLRPRRLPSNPVILTMIARSAPERPVRAVDHDGVDRT